MPNVHLTPGTYFDETTPAFGVRVGKHRKTWIVMRGKDRIRTRIYYSRSIIESVNSKNLLVALQSMRALLEVVAAVRFTLEKMKPIAHGCSTRGIVTAEEAHRLNYHCDLLLHGGKFDWEAFFEQGAWVAIEKKNKERTKEKRRQFEDHARARYLKVESCMKSWSKDQPLAGFAYDYFCDLVHPNKGSNLTIIVERAPLDLHSTLMGRQSSAWPSSTRSIFPLVVRLCADEFGSVVMLCATLGVDEDRIKTLAD